MVESEAFVRGELPERQFADSRATENNELNRTVSSGANMNGVISFQRSRREKRRLRKLRTTETYILIRNEHGPSGKPRRLVIGGPDAEYFFGEELPHISFQRTRMFIPLDTSISQKYILPYYYGPRFFRTEQGVSDEISQIASPGTIRDNATEEASISDSINNDNISGASENESINGISDDSSWEDCLGPSDTSNDSG